MKKELTLVLLIPVALTLFGFVIVRVVLSCAVGLETEWYQAEKHVSAAND